MFIIFHFPGLTLSLSRWRVFVCEGSAVGLDDPSGAERGVVCAAPTELRAHYGACGYRHGAPNGTFCAHHRNSLRKICVRRGRAPPAWNASPVNRTTPTCAVPFFRRDATCPRASSLLPAGCGGASGGGFFQSARVHRLNTLSEASQFCRAAAAGREND